MYENYGLLLEGEWRPGASGETIEVRSPATEKVIGTIPAAGQVEIEAALAAASEGCIAWSQEPAWSRATILRRTAELLRERNEA